MTAEIQVMNTDIQNYNKNTKELGLSISDLQLKLKGSEKESLKTRQEIEKGINLIKNFKFDLHEMANSLQTPKLLKNNVRKLYQNYCKDSAVVSSHRNPELDFKRQKEYLEDTIKALQQNAIKVEAVHKKDSIRIMQEKGVLLSEINDIKKSLASKVKIDPAE
jgi:hypothetical protein